MINIQELLTEQDIPFWLSGENCTRGWTNVQCPFCDDKLNHLGINNNTGIFHCWKCGETDTLSYLLTELLEISFKQAKQIIKRHRTDYIEAVKDKRPFKRDFKNILPKEAIKEIPDEHYQYLIDRRFSPRQLAEKYDLYFCEMYGKYKMRIIIPIKIDDQIVHFTSLSVANADLRYKACENEDAIIDRQNLLYDIDSIQDRTVLIVEGPTDKWRLGDNTVASLTTSFSQAQIKMLVHRVDAAYIMFDSKKKDSNAPRQAEKLANNLAPLIKSVDILYLDEGDPDDLSVEDVKNIRKSIGI